MISLHDVEHMKRQFLNSECKFVELMSFVRFLRVKLFYLSDVTSTIISFFFFIVVRFFFSSYTNFVEKRGIWCLWKWSVNVTTGLVSLAGAWHFAAFEFVMRLHNVWQRNRTYWLAEARNDVPEHTDTGIWLRWRRRRRRRRRRRSCRTNTKFVSSFFSVEQNATLAADVAITRSVLRLVVYQLLTQHQISGRSDDTSSVHV